MCQMIGKINMVSNALQLFFFFFENLTEEMNSNDIKRKKKILFRMQLTVVSCSTVTGTGKLRDIN